jgi:cathepsin K
MSKALTVFVLLIVLLAVGLPQIIKTNDPLEVPYRYAYDMYKTYYNKQWNIQETKYRVTVFRANVNRYEEFNKKPNTTFKMGINRFSDLTQQEFAATYLDLIPLSVISPTNSTVNNQYELKSRIIWSKKNSSLPRDQGSCGSSWAFAAVAAVESAFKSESFIITDFSEQQVIDCVPPLKTWTSSC